MRSISLSAWCISSIDLGALLGGQLGVAPVGQDAEMHPILVDRPKFEEQGLIKPFDDLCFAFHCDLPKLCDAWQRAAVAPVVPERDLMSFQGGTLASP